MGVSKQPVCICTPPVVDPLSQFSELCLTMQSTMSPISWCTPDKIKFKEGIVIKHI